MGLQISDYTKQKAKNVAIYVGTGLVSLIALLSIGTAIANCVAPELTKPLVDLFKGEKNFTLAVSLLALIPLALAVACLIYHHKSQGEVLELTVKKEGNDSIVTGKDLEKLNFDANNKTTIFTDHGDRITIEKTDDVYKVIDSKCDFLKLQDGEEIKLKIYQSSQSLQNTRVINAIAYPTQKAVN